MSRPPREGPSGLWWIPAIAAGAAALAVGWAHYVEPRRLELTRYEIPLEGLRPEGEVTLLHLSDLHVDHLPWTPQQLVAALGADALAAPLLCMTGDFCDRPQALPRVEAVLGGLLHAMALRAERPVTALAIWGNHDRRVGVDALGAVLRRLGVQVLFDAAVRLPGGLWVAGLGERGRGRDGLPATLAAVPPGEPFVLLAHNPAVFPRAAAAGVPLTLAGHTHGGQVRVPGAERLLGHADGSRPYGPGGWYRQGEQALFVSRGLGTTFLPVRWNSRPEATLIRITADPGATPGARVPGRV